jgi:hypothetical protein
LTTERAALEENNEDWDEAPEEDGTSYIPYFPYLRLIPPIENFGVSSANINPHPWRLPVPTIPLQPRQPIPLFEKSNVLVMYVLMFYVKIYNSNRKQRTDWVRQDLTRANVG